MNTHTHSREEGRNPRTSPALTIALARLRQQYAWIEGAGESWILTDRDGWELTLDSDAELIALAGKMP